LCNDAGKEMNGDVTAWAPWGVARPWGKTKARCGDDSRDGRRHLVLMTLVCHWCSGRLQSPAPSGVVFCYCRQWRTELVRWTVSCIFRPPSG